MTRAELRRHHLAERRALTAPDRAARDVLLGAALRAHPWLREARVIAAYHAVGGEPSVRAALDLSRHVVALPRCVGTVMNLHRWDGAPLQPGPFHIPEPAADLPLVDPAEIDLWLVPGVVFDRHGNRLGRGVGHYDRALAGTRGRIIGVAWASAVVDRLPAEPHDVPMHRIVTEAGWIDPRDQLEMVSR